MCTVVFLLSMSSFNAFASQSLDEQLIANGFPEALVQEMLEEQKESLVEQECVYVSTKVSDYDEEGNLLCESKPEKYDEWRLITKEDYHILLERLKEIPMNSQRERAGAEKVNLYGVTCLYGRKYFTADDKVYQLRYGALVSPWSRYSRSMVMTDLTVIFSVLLLTFLIARHYYRSYRERIQAEEYYRNTSNALAHD